MMILGRPVPPDRSLTIRLSGPSDGHPIAGRAERTAMPLWDTRPHEKGFFGWPRWRATGGAWRCEAGSGPIPDAAHAPSPVASNRGHPGELSIRFSEQLNSPAPNRLGRARNEPNSPPPNELVGCHGLSSTRAAKAADFIVSEKGTGGDARAPNEPNSTPERTAMPLWDTRPHETGAFGWPRLLATGGGPRREVGSGPAPDVARVPSPVARHRGHPVELPGLIFRATRPVGANELGSAPNEPNSRARTDSEACANELGPAPNEANSRARTNSPAPNEANSPLGAVEE